MEFTNETFEQNENGEWIAVQTHNIVIDTEQLIADKEAQLLEMYNELQALKEKLN